MPQLMPIMWMISIIFSMMIVLTLINMYLYKEYNTMYKYMGSKYLMMMFKW